MELEEERCQLNVEIEEMQICREWRMRMIMALNGRATSRLGPINDDMI